MEKNKFPMSKIRGIIIIFFIIMIYNVVLIFVSSIDTLYFPTFFKAYVITTDSMSPEIKKDSIIIVCTIKKEKLKDGDIITYKVNGEIITHRIIECDYANSSYKTKGDNNELEDAYIVKYEDVIGKKIISIPYVGKIIYLLKNTLIIIFVVLILLIVYLLRIEGDEKSKRRRLKKKNEDEKRKNSNIPLD